MSLFKKAFAAHSAILRDGLTPITAGEYRLVLSKFKSLESGSVVLKFVVDSKGDGSPTEFEGRAVDHWLSSKGEKAVEIAGILLKKLGLTEDDFDDDVSGLLPEILLVRANVDYKPPYGDKPAEIQIKKILEVVDRTPQSVETDTLGEY